MRWQRLLQIGCHAQGGRGDEPVAIVNAAIMMLKSTATAVATVSRITVRVFQIGSMATSRNTIDGVSTEDLVVNMINASRTWRLNFETSANAILMKKLIIQKPHLQHRNCALIGNTREVVLISLMHFQALDLSLSWQMMSQLRRRSPVVVLSQNWILSQFLRPVAQIRLGSGAQTSVDPPWLRHPHATARREESAPLTSDERRPLRAAFPG